MSVPAPPEAISSAGPAVRIRAPTRRTAPPNGRLAPHGRCSPPPARCGRRRLQSQACQIQEARPTRVRETEGGLITDITDEDDLGVGGDVLGEKGLLVIGARGLMLTGRVRFTRSGQVEEVKPALGTDRHHKVLSNKRWGHHEGGRSPKELCCRTALSTHLPFVADVSDRDTSQLPDKRHIGE